MKITKLTGFILILAICELSEGKGGRGGGFSRGSSSRGSSSRGSSSGSSWFSSSKPASRPAASPSYSKPAPSYGWNANSPSTAARPAGNQNIGWNVGNSPHGPPPAYPGLANRPVGNVNSPPAYSPSYSNPPAYNPNYRPGYSSNTYNRQNNYNTHSSYPNSYNSNPNYGSTFGSGGLGGNTYIHNNYYGGSSRSGGSPFLTNALFYGAGMHHGYMWGGSNSYRRNNWDSEEDRRWRATTKAPYFENKVPGSESYLPAAAVVGAATAFGLASLLPLNVPGNKPLMYCNSTYIAQTQIKLEDTIYSCVNQSIAMSCPKEYENSIIDECLNKTMTCDLSYDAVQPEIYCTNGTLISRLALVCNSTTILNGTNVNETTTILNCYPGMVADKLASFIPTTTTEAPVTTTTEKQLSLGARIHVFFLKLAGKEQALERPATTTTEAPYEDPRLGLKENETAWLPEALTIPPEPTTTTTTTTTTTEAPYDLAYLMPRQLPNGTFVNEYQKIPDSLARTMINASKLYGGSLPEILHKIPKTTENISIVDLDSTTEASSPSNATEKEDSAKLETISEELGY